ncbi:MAG: signal peptidase I [Saprospiraceae bacterium]
MSWFAWLMIIGYVLTSLTLYKVFEKAGVAGWKALVPGLNFYEWSQIVGRSGWYAIWMLVPIVNVFIYAGLAVDMVRSFGKYTFLDSFMAVVLTPISFYLLGQQEEPPYLGPTLPKEKAYAQQIMDAQKAGNRRLVEKLVNDNPYKKGTTREWAEAIVFAVFAAALIRLFLIEAYVIPTSSMEGSLMVGDFLFVSKAHYGIRTPKTVAMIPLLHNTIPKIGGESYWEKPNLTPKRLPALEKIEHNSPVVFNLPAGDSVYIFPDRTWTIDDVRYGMVRDANPNYERAIKAGKVKLVTRPMDKRDHYIKRCIGLPGDTLQIIDRQVYIDGKAAKNPTNMQFLYLVQFPDGNINERNFSDWGISAEDNMKDSRAPNVRYMFLSEEQKQKVQGMDSNILIEPYQFPTDRAKGYNPDRLFPHDSQHFGEWTVDNYGPIWIPKKGVTIPISMDNINMFRRIISVYEENDLQIKGGKIFINGAEASSYTFKMDYYWMMGDNRHNSEDSRVWGFVPEDHVVGKPLFIWFSLKEGSLGKGVNWKRVFTSADRR